MSSTATVLPVIILAAFVFTFGVVIVIVTSLIGRRKTPKDPVSLRAQQMPYECGLPGIDPKDSKISIKFYLTAILFILFDIEIIFMYPWALKFVDFIREGTGGYMLSVMGVFVAIFVVGLVWEVKTKALDWN